MGSLVVFAIFVLLLIFVGVLSVGMYALSVLLGGFANLRRLLGRLMGWHTSGTRRDGASSRADAFRGTGRTSADGSNGASRGRKGSADRAKASTGGGGKVFAENEGTYIDFEEVK